MTSFVLAHTKRECDAVLNVMVRDAYPRMPSLRAGLTALPYVPSIVKQVLCTQYKGGDVELYYLSSRKGAVVCAALLIHYAGVGVTLQHWWVHPNMRSAAVEAHWHNHVLCATGRAVGVVNVHTQPANVGDWQKMGYALLDPKSTGPTVVMYASYC